MQLPWHLRCLRRAQCHTVSLVLPQASHMLRLPLASALWYHTNTTSGMPQPRLQLPSSTSIQTYTMCMADAELMDKQMQGRSGTHSVPAMRAHGVAARKCRDLTQNIDI
jgi:hypothetical protein